MLFSLIFSLVSFLIAAVIIAAAFITAWWLWKKATTPEGEPAPKWGNLRPLLEAFKGRSVIFRMIVVAVLAVAMTIPMDLIHGLTRERYGLYTEVVGEISSSWGSKQLITGPVLYVPYTVKYQTVDEVPMSAAEITFEQSKGSGRTTKEVVRNHVEEYTAMVLPDGLSVDGKISTETRYRGIYSARVYTADVKVSGSFSRHDITGLRPNVAEVHWDKAVLVTGITNTKAIRAISDLDLAGGKHKFLPGTGNMGVLMTGFSVPCDLAAARESPPAEEMLAFSFDISVGGSDGFFMTPLGVTNEFSLASDWPHPKFTGSGLPASREIGAEGFTAQWNVPNLVRNYPQAGDTGLWNDLVSGASLYGETPDPSLHNIDEYVVGVEFAEPVFFYSLLMRAIKYGLLFIALTYLGVVIFENYYSSKGGAMLNAAQYAVIGVALALFYLTLLAVSEHVGFTNAYIIASAQAVIMTGCYVGAAMRRLRPAVMIAVVQSLLYALLFLILRMEDYALLAGTVLLVAAAIALMAVTRGINRPKHG